MRILFSITFLLVINNAFAQKYESYKKLKDTTFQSSSLGYGKDISIVVPLEWEASIDKKFPVILIFDKQNERSNNYIINTIDYITTNYQMPSCIVISVASTFEYRYKETSYKISTPSGKAKENEQFIFDELLPFAEEELKANAFRLLIGHSRYGYYTSSLFVNRIHDLNAVIALCPFYEQEQVNFADSSIHYKPKNDQPVKYYRAGVESLYIEDYYRLENQVNKNNINIKATEFKHADHNVIPGLAIAPALYDVFHYWAKEQNRYYKNTVFNAKELELIAENTQAHYGEALRLSIGVLNGVGWGFFGRKEYKSAIQAWELLLKEYPSFADAYWGIIESQKELKIDKQETIRAFKKCLADYDYYTPEEKIEMLKELE